MAHMHYTGTGNVHSFRGLLATDGQTKVRIEGAVGAIAWRIVKFQTIGQNPGANSYETVTQIWREEQTSITASVDLSNDECLGVSYFQAVANLSVSPAQVIIQDNALFVRNIFVTSKCGQSGTINYYIELEEVKVSKVGMAQLAVAAARRTS